MNHKIERELKRIQENIPKELLSGLTTTQDAYPTLKNVIGLMMKDGTVSEETKKKYQAIMDSGILNATEEVVDTDIEKKISDYIDAEIKKAIKLGRIPKPKKEDSIINYKKKIKRNAKRKNSKVND